MISNTSIIYFTFLFCFAVYVRRKKIIQEKIDTEKNEIARLQELSRRELTQQYSHCSSVPSLSSDDFSDDESTPYDATYCISSDMPFSIPGKPINDKLDDLHNTTFDHHFLNRHNQEHHLQQLRVKRYSAKKLKVFDEPRIL